MTDRPLHLELATVEGRQAVIGRDPRRMSAAELNALGHHKRSLLRVIRENCIGCCAGHEAEVRRCALVDCPLWPYRMATNPFHAISEAQQAVLERLHADRGRSHAHRAARGRLQGGTGASGAEQRHDQS